MSQDKDEGPQLVHIATLGKTPLPSSLPGMALILRMVESSAGLAEWIKLCTEQDCALITASMNPEGEDLPPNGVDGFVSFDMAADEALREDFPDLQIVAANLTSRHLAMQAGEYGADALFFGDLYLEEAESLKASVDMPLAEWWTEIMEIPCIVPVSNADEDPDFAPEFIAVPLG